MLTRLIQRTNGVSEWRLEYEYDYRDAEYEYEYRDAEYEYEYDYRDAEYEYEPAAETWRTKRWNGAKMAFRFFKMKITRGIFAR